MSAYPEPLKHVLRTLGGRQRAILVFLVKHGPQCNRELAESLGFPENTIKARICELRRLRLVVRAYRDLGPQYIRVWFWRVMPSADSFQLQPELFERAA